MRVQTWQYVLTAKHAGIKDAQGSAIAYGVYIPREGEKHRTTINADISTELGWLAHISDHTSPHHYDDLADMWRALHTQGYDPNSRLPAMVKAPSEGQAAVALRMHHCHGKKRPATPQATCCCSDFTIHRPPRGPTTTLIHRRYQPWAHARVLGGAPHKDSAPSRLGLPLPNSGRCPTHGSAHHGRSNQLAHGHGGRDRNPTRSSFFRDTPHKDPTPHAPPSSLKDMDLNNIVRGAHFAHCGGGAAVEKEAYIPSNWGITSHMCNGYSAAHNCGHSCKHVISGGGKLATNNAVPPKLPKEWSQLIPPSLYFAAMASSGNATLPSLHGRCAVHIGSGTGSMKRELMLTGAFVIGVAIKSTVDAGSRVEHTAVVADYDTFESRMDTLVESSIHGMGFRRADNDLIAFDADCATRSQITMNVNGRCRNPTTGHVDHTKPGAEEAARRDRIDGKAIQWMDSVLHAHSDTECIAKATAWPHGPEGWGFSETDAHTILISPPRGGTPVTPPSEKKTGSGPASYTSISAAKTTRFPVC